MENNKINPNAGRQIPIRVSKSVRYTSKRLSSSSTRSIRKDSRGVSAKIQCLRTNRVVFGLILIALWGYIGFHFQSRWAHYEDNKQVGSGFKGFKINHGSASARLQKEIKKAEALLRNNVNFTRDLNVNEIKIVTLASEEKEVESNVSNSNSKNPILKEDLDVNKTVDLSVTLPNEEKDAKLNVSNPKPPNPIQNSDKNETEIIITEIKEREDRSKPKSPNLKSNTDSNNTTSKISNPPPSDKKKRKSRKTPKSRVIIAKDPNTELEENLIPKHNTSYGLIVGPFTQTEDAILQHDPNKNRLSCDKKGLFAKTVISRTFVLIFHELSMTGAPLSMMELASELMACGAHVSVVVVNRKGGLLQELEKRGIKVIKDRAEGSFKAALKADLVIAGSAVCSSWIEQYLSHNPNNSNNILWWIMENRREYFDRSIHLLNKVKMLAFLSEYQLKKWVSWCEKENIKLNSTPMLVPLSVNDELAFVAGIKCDLNTNEFSVDKMNEKKRVLRNEVRYEMGLGDNDVLVLSLSSINPGKGQKLFLEASLLVVEDEVNLVDFEIDGLFGDELINQTKEISNESTLVNSPNKTLTEDKNLTLVNSLDRTNESKEIKRKVLVKDTDLTLVTPLNQTNETKEIKTKDLVEDNMLTLIAPLNQTNETKEIKTKNLFENEVVIQANSLNQTNNTNKPKKQTKVSLNQTTTTRNNINQINNTNTGTNPNSTKIKHFLARKNLRDLLSNKEEKQKLKVLIGSLGSKSNKVPYIKAILRFITQHKNMSNIVMFTPATTRVASLYAAADIYVINAQGIGETFGRVTIEAMAFGLPVVGTDAGGTKEIVKDKITGLLHPIGRDGIETLAENIQYLINNKDIRIKMGEKGRQVVIHKYLKNNTYNNFAQVLSKCMGI